MTEPLPPHLTGLMPWRSGLAFACDWALIAACFAAAIMLPHPAVYGLAFVLIARTQLALAVLMHEGAHGLLAHDRRRNDLIAQCFAAGPLLLSLFAYREGHLQHHRAPMVADDPVARVFGIADYPVSRGELAWRLFKDLCGVGYVLTVTALLRAPRPAANPARRAGGRHTVLVIGSIVLSNAALLGVLAAVGHAALYLGLWILPALTVLQLFARMRAITEHAGYPASDDQRLNARSIVRPSWQTFFCGPHAVHFHIEHHQHVRTPFYRLRAVHRFMHQRGELPAANLFNGYGQVLKDVVR